MNCPHCHHGSRHCTCNLPKYIAIKDSRATQQDRYENKKYREQMTKEHINLQNRVNQLTNIIKGGMPTGQYKTKICSFFVRGKCNKGQSCTFIHPGID